MKLQVKYMSYTVMFCLSNLSIANFKDTRALFLDRYFTLFTEFWMMSSG